jgi:hypothetical protein
MNDVQIAATRRVIVRGFAFFPIAATIALAIIATVPAHAFGERHPFCLQGDEWPGLSNCRFDSYAQCLASASGRALQCIANPYFAGRSDDPYATPYRPGPQPLGTYYPTR